ncbi:methyl-accepting chemotaxis protein [Haloferax namakaokahaiae]|uniref:Methyl-accepting chemotaxis protein n=1 Tax=Haloferax namakaokahaiae TaxID=1748331 RepID=A0ABD5ZAP9_9EURY
MSRNLVDEAQLRLPDAITQSYMRQLVSILLLVSILVAGIGAVQYQQTAATLDENAREGMLTEAQRQSIQVESWFETRTRLATIVADDPATSSAVAERASGALADAKDDMPADVAGLYLINTETTEVLSSSEDGATGSQLFESGSIPVPAGTNLGDDEVDRTNVYVSDGVAYIGFVAPLSSVEPQAIVLVAEASSLGTAFEGSVEGEFTQIVSSDGTVFYDGGGGQAGGMYPAFGAAGLQNAFSGGTGVSRLAPVEGFVSSPHVVAHVPLEGGDVLLLHAPASNVYALSQSVGIQIATLIFLSLLGFVAFTLLIRVGTAVPLIDLSETVSSLRSGDLDVEVETTRNDELGQVIAGIDNLRTDLKNQRGDARRYSDSMAAAADGDLTVRLPDDSDSDDMRMVADAYNEMMDDIEQTVATVSAFGEDVSSLANRVAERADEVASASEEVSESVQQISDGATEQTDSLVAVTNEVNDLSASVQQIASSADELVRLTEEAEQRSHDGQGAASEALSDIETIRSETEATVEEVHELDDRLSRVGEIVDVITEIAEQTDILALNANIEAARAGEAGEGFAVVSNEVKSLAQETKASAGDIQSLIDEIEAQRDAVIERIERMQSRVEEGAESVDDALASFDGIVERVEETSASVREISDATQNQANSSQEVLSMTDEIAGISEETAAESETVSAAAQQQSAALLGVNQDLRELTTYVTHLDDLLDEFDVSNGEVADASLDETDASRREGSTPRREDSTEVETADDLFEPEAVSQ